jgi:acetyl-CoA carboxylase biotin carboxyl carrier protein
METEDKITYADILLVLESIKATSQFEYIHLKFGDVEIDLSRGAGPSAQPSSSTAPPVSASQPPDSGVDPKPAPVKPAPEAVAAAQPQPDTWPSHSILVRSPMVGTFYRKPSPDSAPFVEVGQRVEEGSTLCIIEVMKLMSSISAGAGGVITHILVANEESVEPDQILMVIDPR